jgi:hypothetical protein
VELVIKIQEKPIRRGRRLRFLARVLPMMAVAAKNNSAAGKLYRETEDEFFLFHDDAADVITITVHEPLLQGLDEEQKQEMVRRMVLAMKDVAREYGYK